MFETQEKNKWTQFRFWLKKRRKLGFFGWTIFVLIALFVISFAYINLILKTKQDNNTYNVSNIQKPAPKPKPVIYYSPLTGKIVNNEDDTKMAVTGIMIENSPDARPQSGLKDSGIVFEAIAEGGITRFLVLYQQEKPQLIGPVRSLRLYDADWAAAFDCSIGHIGGSARALAEVRNGNYRDIDQFFNSKYYWRASDRYSPHNVYTSFEKIDALNSSKGYTTSNFTGFERIDGKASETPNATEINVTISSFLYNSIYYYNSISNSYERHQGGAPHLDREQGQISPNVIIVMKVDENTVLEDGYRENITTIGSGEAVIFQNGTVINATWNKESKTSQIFFTDTEGRVIPLVRGQTWITAIPNDKGSVSWQ